MRRELAVTDLGVQLRSLVDEVAESHEPCVMTRDDKPVAVLIAYDDYAADRRSSQIRALADFTALWERLAKRTAHLSEAEIAADVAAARAELPG